MDRLLPSNHQGFINDQQQEKDNWDCQAKTLLRQAYGKSGEGNCSHCGERDNAVFPIHVPF